MAARPPKAIRRFFVWLLTPEPTPAIYVLKVWPFDVVPAALLAALVIGLAAVIGHPREPMKPPGAGFFMIVLLGPALETLLMVPILWALRRLTSRKLVVIALSAAIWAALHATQSVAQAAAAFWGFFVMSAAFVAWREKSFRAAVLITFTLHALNNFCAWILIHSDRVGGSRAAVVAGLLLMAGMVGSLWLSRALARTLEPPKRLDIGDVFRFAKPAPQPLAVHLARSSWICPILGLVAVVWLKDAAFDTAARESAALMLAPLIGFLLGVAALLGTLRHGARRIAAPALTGMLMSSVLLLIWLVVQLRKFGPAGIAHS